MFDKIITISLNPALDVTLWVQTMDFQEPNKTTREETYAGGKAINISRVLSALGVKNKALGICGESNFRIFTEHLTADKVDFDFYNVAGMVRENITLIIPDGRVFKVNRTGPPVSREKMVALRERILAELEGFSDVLLVFAGSLPPNFSGEAYRAYITSFQRPGVRIALDTSVFTIEDVRAIKPYIIKPNLLEFRQMSGSDLRTEQSIVKQARSLTDSVEHVLVSLGGKGLIYADGSCALRVLPPRAEVKSTVGAGDTTLAAYIYGLHCGFEIWERIQYAAAAGTASVTLDGTDVITPELVARYLPQVSIKNIR